MIPNGIDIPKISPKLLEFYDFLIGLLKEKDDQIILIPTIYVKPAFASLFI
jgi:hypothetical protein